MDFCSDNTAPIYWAVIYVPDGLDNNPGLTIGANPGAAAIYEPSQNVMMFGGCNAFAGVHQQSRMSRNLCSGDGVIFVIQSYVDAVINVRGVVSLVVAFN
jgi:hypothetical protein